MIKQITLIQASKGAETYIVDSLVNRINPQVGSVLNEREANQFIIRRDTKVVIKRTRI